MKTQTGQAVSILKKGGIVIFPTDTAFGIGCVIDNQKAVERLFEIRKRPPTQATPVLVESIEMAREYLMDIPQDVEEKLMKKYWPGALTIVLNCKKDMIPELVRGGTDTLGVRIPNHPTTLEIIRALGKPILGPSANFHGDPTPYTFESLDPELVKLVDFVVKGECTVKEASTVIDCTVSPWNILRQGAIQLDL
jgi:L-threonylcarbamoyladenylate synthase